jgi:hypothetical protein
MEHLLCVMVRRILGILRQIKFMDKEFFGEEIE